MIGFDDGRGGIKSQLPNIRSMVGFDDLRGSSLENTPPIPPDHQRRVDELMKTTQAIEAFKRERILVEQGVVSGAFRPDQFGYTNDYPYAKELGFTDQDIRFYIEGFYSKILGKRIGPLMQVVLGDPNFGPLPKYLTGNGGAGVFDYENDYPYAVSLGFTDQDIRYYLENFYTGIIADDMRRKLNDPSWGRIPEFYVTITAPGCPPENPPKDDYGVIPIIKDIYIEQGGFGYKPEDTATLLDCVGNPDAATKLEFDVDQNGSIIKMRVIQSGTNFACVPEIRMNTKTGYNARLKPILRFRKEFEDDVPAGTVPLKVIDCVGTPRREIKALPTPKSIVTTRADTTSTTTGSTAAASPSTSARVTTSTITSTPTTTQTTTPTTPTPSPSPTPTPSPSPTPTPSPSPTPTPSPSPAPTPSPSPAPSPSPTPPSPPPSPPPYYGY